MNNESFSSRWGIILASLGMAIGAGNIWRFPRLAGQYGGTFIILWIVFLLVWSIPILLAEFSIGKKYKQGVIGSFSRFAGKKYSWMGFFITFCTLGIAFYYSVITGWALRFLGFSLSDVFAGLTGAETLAEHMAADPNYLKNQWHTITHGNITTIVLHIFSVALGVGLLVKGIQNGLEKANKILIPSLFVLLIITGFISLSLDGALKGLEYMFTIKPELFSDPKVWIEALSQSAWSTGAGWGLIMTIASYSRSKEDVTLNTFIGGFGNNTASLIAGMTILPAVFGLAGSEEAAISALQAGNQGLTFTVIPHLFTQISGGAILSVIFFLALFIAALSSLLPMLELFIKHITDLGIARKTATVRAGVACIVLGLPSAYSLEFFNNQDWVWGIGLVISGLFIIFAVLKHGIQSFKAKFIDTDSDMHVSTTYFTVAIRTNIFLGATLIIWWLSQGYSAFPWFTDSGMWNVFDQYSNATVITQWACLILIGLGLNKFLSEKFGANA